MKIWDVFDDFASPWDLDWFSLPNTTNNFSTVRKYRVYDPEKFELTPKEAYKKELATLKEEEIKNIEERLKKLNEELKQLKSG